MIQRLLAHGVSIEARDSSGARAIELANTMHAADAVALLSL
jgi:hypothetical protein